MLLSWFDVGHPARRAQWSLASLLALWLLDLLALVRCMVGLLIDIADIPRHLFYAIELLHRAWLLRIQTGLPWEVLQTARSLFESESPFSGVAHVPLLEIPEVLLRLGLGVLRNPPLNWKIALDDLRVVQTVWLSKLG